MLDGWHEGELAGSGTVVWHARRELAAGRDRLRRVPGHGRGRRRRRSATATPWARRSSMNAMAEALGMSLPGCAAIPAPYRERGQMAYATGRRIVEMVRRGPAALEDPDPRGVRERHRRGQRHRRLDQLPAAPHRDRAACRRRARHRGLGARSATTFRCWSTAAGGRVPGRGVPPRGRRAGGDARAAAGGQAARRARSPSPAGPSARTVAARRRRTAR